MRISLCARGIGIFLLVVAGFAAGAPGSDVIVPAPVVTLSDLASQPQLPAGERPSRPEPRRSQQRPTVPDSVIAARQWPTADATTTPTTSTKTVSAMSPASLLPASLAPISANSYSATSSPPASAGFTAVLSDLTALKPDSQGALGPDYLMTTLSSQIVIQDRQGRGVSTNSLNSFWAGLRPGLTVFDPHLLYEPYGQRFLFTAVANPGATNAGLLLAVSQTSDPRGAWNRYFIRLDTVNPIYGLSPHVGFNKNWIVAQVDTFARTNAVIGTNSFTANDFVFAKVFVFNKTDVYANVPTTPTEITIDDLTSGQIPAQTYDTSLEQIYLMNNFVGSDQNYGFLRIYTISGTVTAPFLVADDIYATPLSEFQDWSDVPPANNFGPQLGSTTGIMTGDSTLGSVIYRGGSLFTVHTEYFPPVNPTYSGIVFWEVAPADGFPYQRVVISDSSAQTVRAFPSVAVNEHFDVLVAYSLFSQGGYASAAFSFRSGGGAGVGQDVLGTLRSEVLLKAGEAPYVRTAGNGQNSWGDWTAAVVDPINGVDLWTLQEYAATPSGGSSRWGTWWGRISPFVSLTASITATPNPILAGGNLTYNVTVLNNRDPSTTGETGVRVVDPLPLGATYVSASSSQGTCGLSNNAVVCDIGLLLDGAQATASIVVKVNTAGSITNTATVSANGIDFDPTDDSATVVTTVNPAADLAVSLTDAPDPVNVSGLLTYSILVTNPGPSAATAVSVRDTIPTVMTNISAQSSIGVCSTNGSTVTCNLGTLLAGSSAAITIRVIPSGPGNVTNTASVSATSQDPVSANNLATVTTRVNARPSISAIAPKSTLEDTPTAAIPFTIADAETPSDSLSLSPGSSDITIVPLSNIAFTGTGGNRFVTITPLPDQFGSVTVSISVADPDGAVSVSSFVLTVTPVNDLPTLGTISNLTMNEDATAQVTLTGIASGAPNESQILVVAASSSSPLVVPNPQVTYTSPGSTALLNVTPVANASGSATITVTVNDGGTSNNLVTRTFTVTVNPVNDAPTLDPISNVIIPEDSPQQTINLTGITSGAPNESQTLTVTATSSDTNVLPHPTVVYASPNSAGTLLLAPQTNAFGVATVTVTVNDGGVLNNLTTRTFTVSINSVNDAPTLDAIGNLSLGEDNSTRTINLTGIGSGAANEIQTLTVTASSSDASIVPNPSVNYSSPNATGSLTLTPTPDAFGSVTITVRVDDGASLNNVVTRQFTVTIDGINDPPVFDTLSDFSVSEDAGGTIVALTGISAGPQNENQTVVITATSSNPSVVPDPTVSYSSPSRTGTLTIVPLANAFGVATISVTANDGGASNNLLTRTFNITVVPVNDPPTLNAIANVSILEDSGPQIIPLSGITSGATNENQTLTVLASSSDEAVTGPLVVNYASPASSGSLTFVPPLNAAGSATVTVQAGDGGLSNNVISRTFTVTVVPVNDPPTLDAIPNLIVDEDSGVQVIGLTGISSGAANEPQTLTVSATSSNPQIIPTPAVTYSSPDAGGTLRLTPAPNANGLVTITVTVNDGGTSNNLVSRIFTVTVNSINDLPSIAAIDDTVTLEDTPITIALDLSDVETPIGQLLLEGNASNEELVSSADIAFGGTAAGRTVTIPPLPDQFGSTTITITVRDLDGGSATTSFELFVFPVNDAPRVFGLGPQVMDEDTSLTVPFTVFDPESISDDILVSVFSATPDIIPTANLALSGTSDQRSLTLAPAPNQFGLALIYVVCSDPDGGVSTNLLRVTVVSVNDLPIISSISSQTILEDTPTTPIPLTVSDIETLADDLTLTGFSSDPSIVSNNRIVFSGTGANRSLVVTPNTNANGSVVITAVVHDADGGASSNSFALNITPVNDAPIFSIIPLQRTQQDTSKVINFVLDDPETPNSLSLAASSSNSSLVPNSGLVLGGNGTARTITATPSFGQLGDTVVTLSATDPEGAISIRTFVLTVTARPSISTIHAQNIREDVSTGPLPFVVGDLETAAEFLEVTVSSSDSTLFPPGNITLSGSGSNRFVSLLPSTNASGQATITLTVHDQDGGAANSSFVLNVLPVNDLPFISGIPDQTTDEDIAKVVNFTVGDLETTSANLSVSVFVSDVSLLASAVAGGSGANRILTLAPAPDQFGSTPVTVVVTDSDGGSSGTTFVFRINPVNDRPTLASIPDLAIDEDSGPRNVTLSGIGSGAANENQVLSITSSSSNPALIPTPIVNYSSPGISGTLTFAPATNANGTATITVSVNDGADTNNIFTRTFTVTVNPVNDPPVISTLADQGTDEDVPLGPIPFTVDDVDGLSGLTVTGSSSNSGLVPNSSIAIQGSGSARTVTITPQPNQNGVTTITLTAQDTQGATATSIFKLTVNPVDDPPTISSIGNQAINEDTSTAALAFVVGDPESAATALSVTARSSNQQLLPDANIVLAGSDANRTVRLTPSSNQSGSATVTVTVRDSEGLATSTSFLLTVNAVNDAPTLAPIADQTIAQNFVLGLPLGLADIDSAPASFILTASSSNQGLAPNTNLVFGGSGLARTIQITPIAGQTGAATITIAVSDGIDTSSRSFVLTVTALNQPPSFNAIPDLAVNEDAGLQTVPVSGIAGAATLTAISGNPGLIPNPTVSYTAGSSSGSLTFTPVANSNGVSTVTVTAGNGVGQTLRTFVVTVNSVNDAPTIAAVGAQTTLEDTPVSFPILLADIDTPALFLTVTAISTNTTLVSATNIVVEGTGTNRTVTITPARNQVGNTLITLFVSDRIASNSTSFNLSVTPVNDPPTLDPIRDVVLVSPGGNGTVSQTVPLTGISRGGPDETAGTVTVTATSGTTTVIANPSVTYTSGSSTGMVTVTSVKGATGNSTITVTVNDGSGATVVQTFTAYLRSTANANPTLSSIANVAINEDSVAGPISFTINDSGTPAASLVVTARSLNTNLLPAAGVVLGGSGTARTITLTPAANQFGTGVVRITVTDTQFGSTNSDFVLTVNSVNDAPTISTIAAQSIAGDVPSASIAFFVNDVDTPLSSLLLSGSSSNPGLISTGNIAFGGDGTNRALIITPVAGQSGSATITVSVADGQTNASTSFNVVVTSGNHSPVLAAIPDQTTLEDTPTPPIPLTVSDAETPAANLTLAATSSNPALVNSFTFGGSGANRTLVLTPVANQNGSATIAVTVSDGAGASSTNRFVLTVTPVNDPPTLAAISDVAVNEGAGLQTINLSGIAAGAGEGNVLAVTAVSSNPNVIPHPVVSYTSPASTGTLAFSPTPGTNGSAVISVTVNDGQTLNNTITRTFTVTVNDKPFISFIPDQVSSEETVIGPVPFTISDRDTPASSLNINVSSSNAALIPNANVVLGGSGSSRTLQLTPLANQFGTSTITVTVADTNNLSASRSFVVVVLPANDSPSFNALADLVISEDAGPQVVALSGITVGPANESGTLSFIARSSNPALIPDPIVNYTSPAAGGSLTFAPAPNANGSAVITVSLTDSGGQNNAATRTFTVTVNPVNDLPTLNPIQDVAIAENAGAQTVALTGITPGPADEVQALTISAISDTPALIPDPVVTYAGGASATLRFTSALNATGSARITVTVNDGGPQNNLFSRTFTIVVTSFNDAPTLDAVADLSIPEDSGSQTVNLTGITAGLNDTQPLSVTAASSNPALIGTPAINYVTPNPFGRLTFAPAPNANGSAMITVTVSDGISLVARSFVVNVLPINDPPAFDPISDVAIDEDAGVQVVLLTGINAGPNETPAGSLVFSATSSNPALIPNPTIAYASPSSSGSLAFAPAANASGSAVITLTLDDGGAENNLFSRSFTVLVRQINDPPTFDAISNLVIDEDAGVQVVPLTGINAGPNETPAGSLVFSATSSNPALIPNPTIAYASPSGSGSLAFAPVANASGSAVITVTLDDGGAENNLFSRSFTVMVNPVNDPPAFDPIADVTIDQDSGLQTVTLTGIKAGPPDEIQTLALSAVSSNAALIGSVSVVYTSPDATGLLRFAPVAGATGNATIFVTLRDSDPGSQNSFTRSFQVAIRPVTITNVSPSLRIDKVGGNVVISWPATAVGFVLQAKLAFDPFTSWAPISQIPVTNGGRCFITNAANAPARFYQLAKLTNQDTNTRPVLRIEQIGPNVVVSWPSNLSGFVLQSRPAFDVNSPWVTVPDIYWLLNGRFYITNAPAGFARFYQLAKSSGQDTNAAPLLRIEPAGSNVIVSWPTTFSDYVLQSKFVFGGADSWQAVPDERATIGGRFYVTNSATGFSRFYQLAKTAALPRTASLNIRQSAANAIGSSLEPNVNWVPASLSPLIDDTTPSVTDPTFSAELF